MTTAHFELTHLRCKRQRIGQMPVAMHFPHPTETSSHEARQHQNLVEVRSRVQVSVEDAEVLLGTAERISAADKASDVPYKTQRTSLQAEQQFKALLDSKQMPLQLLSNHLNAPELQRSASVPLAKHDAEHKGCLHTSHSLPGEIDLPEQAAAPPVKVPKGLRSNRLRKQASNLSSSLGVIKSAGTAKGARASVQENTIKSFRPSPVKRRNDGSGMLLLLEACDALAANPLLAEAGPLTHPSTRREDWAGASPIAKGTGSSHKTRRVNLLEDGAYDGSMGVGRRIRKPLDNDFLYYGSAGNTGGAMDYSGQDGCEGAEEGMWGPGGRRRGGRGELQGPCNHCFAEDSPQWRKGPRCKPVLCNACGTRFLRTRSLGKTRNTKSRAREPTRFAEALLNDMMDEDEEEDYAPAAAPAWGIGTKHDSLMLEQDNVSSSTTVAGMPVGYDNGQHGSATATAAASAACNMYEEQSLSNLSQS